MTTPRPTTTRPVPLAEVASLVGATLVGESLVVDPVAGSGTAQEVLVSGVTLDSHDVAPGDLYAGVPGARVHGADFAGPALQAGAVAVLTDAAGLERVRGGAGSPPVPVLVVDSPREVLGQVASAVYATGDLALRTVGVTGTNGKTTTAYLLRSALAELGRRTGLIGTVETTIGDERIASVRTTPEATVLHALLAVMVERGMDDCAMEVSSHALAQHRVDGVRYDLALFTNLSRDHLEFHGTMREYFAAKASLFTPERAVAGIVVVDDEWGQELATTAGIPVTTLTTRADVTAAWRVVGSDLVDPQAFSLEGPGGRLSLRSALPGEFNRANTALAALALLGLGHPADRVEAALAADPRVPGRMERVRLAGVEHPLAVVDYAHTPDAVAAALVALRPQTGGRLVVVLGAGGDRDPGKREAMGAAAATNADVVVVTDDNPRSEDPAAIRAALLAGARASGGAADVVEVGDRGAAIRAGVARALEVPGSTLAVVGKGHETGQDVAGTVHHFDDREAVAGALADALGVPGRAPETSGAPETPGTPGAPS